MGTGLDEGQMEERWDLDNRTWNPDDEYADDDEDDEDDEDDDDDDDNEGQLGKERWDLDNRTWNPDSIANLIKCAVPFFIEINNGGRI